MRTGLNVLSITVLFFTLLAGGFMAPASGQGPSAGLTAYTGEVWVWDEHTGVVTLRQSGGGMLRVQMRPEETRWLRHHEIATIYGAIAPPADIERVVIATEAVPVGTAADHVTAPATVRSVNADGVMVVDSDHGLLTVLIAKPVDGRYGPGTPVRVETAVQAMKLVPAGSAPSTASDMDTVAASPRTEPGDFVMVTGPVLSVEASGTMRIESPRGPIALWLPTAHRFRAGEFVRVRTFVAVTH